MSESLYKEDKLKEAGDEIKAMGERFGVTKEDVIAAAWKMAKDAIWAQLERDLQYKKEEGDFERGKVAGRGENDHENKRDNIRQGGER